MSLRKCCYEIILRRVKDYGKWNRSLRPWVPTGWKYAEKTTQLQTQPFLTKKERYLDGSVNTQRERPRDEKNGLRNSSQGLALGPNQGTFSTVVEGGINRYIFGGENCHRPKAPWVSCPLPLFMRVSMVSILLLFNILSCMCGKGEGHCSSQVPVWKGAVLEELHLTDYNQGASSRSGPDLCEEIMDIKPDALIGWNFGIWKRKAESLPSLESGMALASGDLLWSTKCGRSDGV